MHPDDFAVSFLLDNGDVLTRCRREIYDPPTPFRDVVDVWSFLVMQNPPAELLDRALAATDPEWERKVSEHRAAMPDAVQRRAAEQERRAKLREDFKRTRRT
jgi:hypothetical protein